MPLIRLTGAANDNVMTARMTEAGYLLTLSFG